MSKTAKANQSTVKAPTSSGKITKPTAWKDRLNAQDYEELKLTFEVFDEDGSGTIDPAQISKALEELGIDKRNPFILRLITGLKDKNKPISFDEFVDSIASQVGETKTKEGLQKIFTLFDKDENGLIDFQDFKKLAKEITQVMNDDELLEMMHSSHVNHKTSTNEGFVFEQFYKIVSKFANK